MIDSVGNTPGHFGKMSRWFFNSGIRDSSCQSFFTG